MGGRRPAKIATGTDAVEVFRPNDWNPNKMDARTYATLSHDIDEFGFIDPLTVRPDQTGVSKWEIVDGENRWRVARDKGLAAIPYVNLGPIDDTTARKLTIVLNELRGQYDPRKMGDLLQGLLAKETPAQLLETLPFTEEALAGLVGLKDFDWKGLDKKPAERDDGPAKWVERTFRMPPDADAVLKQAFDKVRFDHNSPGKPMEDWQCLEMLAAEYMGS